jgi:hypothetical protein
MRQANRLNPRRTSTSREVLRAEPCQAALGGFVSRNPRITLRTPPESLSFSSLRDGVLLPGVVRGFGLFFSKGLRVHAASLFRSPIFEMSTDGNSK